MKRNLKQEKDIAKALYLKGEKQKDIAEKVGVSEKTISGWVNDLGWKTQKTAMAITRPELINKILATIGGLIEKANESEDINITQLSDQLCKLSNTIQKLDKGNTVVDVMEVFSKFIEWLQQREDVTPQTIKVINELQDSYVKERLSLQK